VDIKRRFAMTFLLGAGVGLTGCQGTGLGKLALWNRGDSSVASAAPDVGRQKYSGLAQEFGNSLPMGQARTGTAPLGGQKPPADDGFMMASWKKTTAAVSGAFAVKPTDPMPEDDPLRLDRNPAKINADVYVSAAQLLENQGKFADAEQKYTEALKSSPNDESALVGLARLYDRQGQGVKAAEVYQRALKAHPKSGLICNDMGLCYRRQRQLDKSVQMLTRAVELQPENNKYRNNLAAALVDSGRSDDAVRQLSVHGSPAVAHYNVGCLMLQKGQRAEATRHLQQALSLDASLTPAREMLGQLSGEGGMQPLAARQQPAQPRYSPSAPRMAAQPRYDGAASYGGGSAETYAPPAHMEAPAAAAPQTYHIGDDGAAAATAQRPNWNGAAWSSSVAGETSLQPQPLPPVD
jgi:Tfp pilus assembly protein PilF